MIISKEFEHADQIFGYFYERLSALSPFGLLIVDRKQKIVAANRTAADMLGVDDSIIVGMASNSPLWQAKTLEGLDLYPNNLPSKKCLETGRAVNAVIIQIWNPEKKKRLWLELNAIPVKSQAEDPSPGYAAVWMHDVTERVIAEKEADEALNKFRMLFDNMIEGVATHELLYDKDGKPENYRIIDVNPEYETHVGISAENAVGRLATDLYKTSPAPYLEEFSSVTISQKPLMFETYFPPLDKYFRISVSPFGKNGFATIFYDISDTKKLLLDLESKNRELESIIYAASHDLRSPLVNIQGFSSRLTKDCKRLAGIFASEDCLSDGNAKKELEGIVTERIPLSLEYIIAGSIKMDSLINGLLKISRLGRSELRPKVLDMNKLASELVSAFAYQLNAINGRIEIETLEPCYADEELLYKALSNIIDNAIKYHSPDRNLVVSIKSNDRGKNVEYTVSDNGLGISKNNLEKVWQLFYRINPKSNTSGEGLGLSIVRRVIDRMNGQVRLESIEDKGTSFYITLPTFKVKKES